MKKLSLNQFAEEVVSIMPLMVREFARREDNALTHGKISCPQTVALFMAAEKGEATMGEITKALSSEKSSASVLVNRLVQQKLMRRRHDAKDRRIVWMSVTPKGRKVVNQILQQKRASFKAIFAKVGERERFQYLSVLRKVRETLLTTAVLLLSLSLYTAYAAEEAVSVPAPASQDVLTLQQAFKKALKRSESVQMTAEDMALAESRFYRAFDYFLPSVRFKMTRFQQDIDDDASSSSGFDFGRQRTPQKRFVFTQPLFSGFKELAAIQGTGADRKEQAFKWKRAKETLFTDVMESYYTVLNSQKDVESLHEVHQLMSKRMEEMGERVKLGRSRESEQKTSLTNIKLIEVDILDAEKNVNAAQNLLAFYVGEDVRRYQLKEDNGESAQLSADLAAASTRSDVTQYEQAYVVTQKVEMAANSHFFPKISLDGNYYTQRVGFQNGNDWDVTLTFDVPVFEFGQTVGDVKEAASNRQRARLAWEEKKRMAMLEARDAYEDYTTALKEEKALSEAHQAAHENYELLQQEYSTNLVPNLDVLDALRSYQDALRRYDAARYASKKSYWNLKSALGDLAEAHPEMK